MREIVFRGKDAQGRWLYGAVVNCCDESCYLVEGIIAFEDVGEACNLYNMPVAEPVLRETVGEFTGLCDAGGEDIFEGDIVQGRSEYFGHDNFCRGVVFWSEGRFVISFGDSVEACEKLEDTEELREWHEDVEVIGNIFDEPELLENGGKLKA